MPQKFKDDVHQETCFRFHMLDLETLFDCFHPVTRSSQLPCQPGKPVVACLISCRIERRSFGMAKLPAPLLRPSHTPKLAGEP